MNSHVIIKQFVEFSRAKAPAKYQKPFKADLLNWMGSLDDLAKQRLSKKLADGLKNKEKFWYPITAQMLEMFKRKGG